jgi:hypothetical protein
MTLHFKRVLLTAGFAAALVASTASHADGLTASIAGPAATASSQLVYDNISAYENGVPGATVTATGSTPNTFMGAAYTLAAGTTAITGFDLFPANLSGTTFTALKMNVYVWGNVNTGTVSAANPAFSNLLGNFSVTSAVDTYPTGSFFSFEGVTLNTPISLTGTTIGLTFNIQGSTDGVNFSTVNSLTSLITYGAAPTVGSNPASGYYRNASGETNGNFISGLRSLSGGATNQSLAVRVYGDVVTAVPEPSVYLMMGLGLAVLGLARRRRAMD